ncbi:unnamed protein product [Mytilus coruscus]|uniref:Uncharacterized protein n=1 Tax=Mytilus coruscus TaxID=42192 RepID=A0A6J8AQH8_MYTCO|nr:unnamed protein product [Mytilus coruscus]
MTDRTPRRDQSYTGGRDDLELNPFKLVSCTPSRKVEMRISLSNLETRPKSPERSGKAEKGNGDNKLRERYAELQQLFQQLRSSVALKYEAFYASRKIQGMSRPVRARSEIEAVQNETAVVVRKVEQTLEKFAPLVGTAHKNKGQDNYNKCHYCGGPLQKNCDKRKKDLGV